MADRATIPFLVGMMLLCGVVSTISMKWQDMTCVANCDTDHPSFFEQPVLQTIQMFMGEAGCWLIVFASFVLGRVRSYVTFSQATTYQSVRAEGTAVDETGEEEIDSEDDRDIPATLTSSQTLVDPSNVLAKPFIDAESQPLLPYQRKPLSGWKVFLLALPAVCDLTGTTVMNAGLLFVAASIFQMTRGALVLFVGLFSVLFLRRHLSGWKWASLFIVVAGVAVVGLAGVIEGKSHSDIPAIPGEGDHEQNVFRQYGHIARDGVTIMVEHSAAETLLGVFLIAVAQIFAAAQYVLEESIMEHYSMEPITVLGWEGFFGLTTCLAAQGILHATIGQTEAGKGGYFDARTGYEQWLNNPTIMVSSVAGMFAVAGLNFFGLSITRTVSATSRSTIDTCRTLIIWIVSLGLGWESFKWLQLVGFALLVWGTGIFNEIVQPPTIACLRRRKPQAVTIET